MRVAELARTTGVPVPTIKYYLREGLLARGELSSPNQASYTDVHVHRLRLIRALTEIGGLSVAATREVLADLDGHERDLNDRLGRIMSAINPPDVAVDPAVLAVARERTEHVLAAHGWADVDEDYPPRRSLEQVIATMMRLGADAMLTRLDGYADVASQLAVLDLDTIAGEADADAVLERAVVGTVLGEALLASLRRVAQAAESGRRLGSGDAVVPRSTGGAG